MRPSDGAEIGIDVELGTQDPYDRLVVVSRAVNVNNDRFEIYLDRLRPAGFTSEGEILKIDPVSESSFNEFPVA